MNRDRRAEARRSLLFVLKISMTGLLRRLVDKRDRP